MGILMLVLVKIVFMYALYAQDLRMGPAKIV